MESLESLQIDITAKATTAVNALDKLTSGLFGLQSAIDVLDPQNLKNFSVGVVELSTAMASLNGLKTQDFTRLTKNVDKLSSINVSGLFNASKAMIDISNGLSSLTNVSGAAADVVNLANSVGTLGSVKVSRALTNIPLLTNELNKMMATLSHAPNVSSNLIQMTNAMANLASQGQRVGTASRSLNNNLNLFSRSSKTASSSAFSLAKAFGKFYASYFLVIRGAKKMWESVKSSMDYVEVLNYFEKSFEQVRNRADLSQFEELGYDSAEAYYNSFEERAKELTSKMTGFKILENGALESTGMVNLGINPQSLMNYQSMFVQMASSMGMTSENAIKVSRALTEIGADLASVRNMDFEKVWKDMASGLAGMSRTLDKYGVNIRNVNLQQKLTDLGIEANIQSLNQNEKALLRTIILLDSTRYAWSDLSETINQPANELRLIQAGFKNLSMTIGGLFLPIVNQVLPYINGLVIALQRLFEWVGKLLGLNIGDLTKDLGKNNEDLSDFFDDLDESISGASDGVKKLKQQLQGFDELNNLTTSNKQDTGIGNLGTGLLDDAFNASLGEYQKAWDEAFSKLEVKAQQIANRIEKAFEPIKKIIKDFAIGDYFQAGKDTSKLVSSFFDFLSEAVDRVDWDKIGESIGKYLDGLDWTEIIASKANLSIKIAKGFLKVFANSFKEAPIETTLITAFSFFTFSKLGNTIALKITSSVANKISGLEIASKLKTVLTADIASTFARGSLGAIGATIASGIISGIITAFAGFNLGKWIATKLNSNDAEEIRNFKWFGEGGLLPSITEDLGNTLNAAYMMMTDFENNPVTAGLLNVLAGPFLAAGAEVLKFGLKIDNLYELWAKFSNWWNSGGVSKWWKDDVSPWFTVGKWKDTGISILKGLSESWNDFTNWWGNNALAVWYRENVKPYFEMDHWTFEGIMYGLSKSFENAISSIKNLWNGFADWFNSNLTFSWDSFEFLGKEIFPSGSFTLGKLPKFKDGGYTPSGSLFWAGENGVPEIMGTVGGRNAVASGSEITGIRDAVQNMQASNESMQRTVIGLLEIIASKDPSISVTDMVSSLKKANSQSISTRGHGLLPY